MWLLLFICILWQLENFKQCHSSKRERYGFTINAGMVSHSENKIIVNEKGMTLRYNVPQPQSKGHGAIKGVKYTDCHLLAGTNSTILSFEYDGIQRIEQQTHHPAFKTENELRQAIANLNSNYNIKIDTNSLNSYQDIALLVEILTPPLAKVCKLKYDNNGL